MDKAEQDVTLYITSKAATDLHEKRKEQERQKMMARIEKEEARRKERLAKQEKVLAERATKKARIREAKDADVLIEKACQDLEEALKVRGAARQEIEKAEKHLADLVKKAGSAAERYAKAKLTLDKLEHQVTVAREQVDKAKEPTDPSIMNLKKSRLREALTIANEKWDKVQKAIRKKERRRDVKAWAKRLLTG